LGWDTRASTARITMPCQHIGPRAPFVCTVQCAWGGEQSETHAYAH
jgi:hypothetical protein